MHSHTRANLNRLAQRLSGADHALQRQLTQPMEGPAPRPWLRVAARVFTSLFLAQTLMAGMPALAQLTAAPRAPSGQKPLIDAAANGTPIVLIAPPSKGGVSRNQYEQLNVGPKGLILNNSTGNVQTQIGGWISGNLQLGLTPARIILNEVTGPHASQLRGTIEVGGQKADIVIANPNGVTCNGCGFLNSDRATLTTGTPRYSDDGAVTGFDVRQGVLQIGPDGLNATEQQQLELHARGLVIEGEVYSQNLQAVIGANQVLYGTLHALPQATAQDGAGEAPRFAIDIKALGGMYAGQIYMIATDKGLGVNSQGRAATLSGSLVLSANGDLTLKDTYASGNVQLASVGKTTLNGQTVADGAVTIGAGDRLTNSGALQARTLELNAPSLNNSGSINQTAAATNLALTLPGGLQNSGQIYTPGNLTVQAGVVSSGARSGTATGQLTAGGTLQVSASSLQLNGQQLAANGSITVQAQALSATDGSMIAGSDVTLDASGKLDVTGATVSANGQARLSGSEIALERARIAAVGNVQIISPGLVVANAADLSSNATLSMRGRRVEARAATMTAVVTANIKADDEIRLDASHIAGGRRVELLGQGISTPGATVVADKIVIDAGTGALTNQGGKVLASSADADALTVNAAGITNRSGELRANGGLSLDASGGVIDNTAGVIAGATGALTNLGGLTNKGGILHTQSDLAIASTALDNSDGAIVTAGSLTVSTPGQTINNARGVMQAGGSVSLDSGGADLKNAGGTVVAGAALTIQTGTIDTAAGTLAAGGQMSVNAHHLQAGHARLGSGGAIKITASGAANLDAAEVGASGDLAIQAGAVQATGANVASNANLQIVGGSITGGNWSAQGKLDATSAGVLDVSGGSLLAGGNITAQGQGIITDGARVAGQAVTLNAGTGALSNLGGQIHARGDLHIQASHLVNRNGTVATGGALMLQGAALENHAGIVQATGNLGIHTAGQALDNTAGRLTSGGNITVQAGAVSNSGGTINAGGTAHVQAAALNTAQGQISGTRQLDILVTQRLTAVGATLGTEGKFMASAADIDVQGASITAGETLGVTASGALDMRRANIAALKTLTVQAGAEMSADAATIRTNEHLAITGAMVSAAGATLSAGGNAQLTATTGAATLNNASLVAGDTAAVTAVGIAATSASIGAVNNVTMNAGAGDITAPQVLVQSQGGSIGVSAANVNLTGSAMAGTPPTTGLLAGHGIAITATGAVDVSGAATYAGTGIDIDTQGRVANNAGRIVAGTQANLSGASLTNQGGTVDANGPITVSVTTGLINNDQGRVSTREVLTLGTLTSLTNAGGVIETAGALNAQLQNFNNEGGSVVALAGLTISGGPVNNTGGQLASEGNVSVNTQGGAFTGNNSKVLSAQGNVTLITGDLQAGRAQIVAQGNFNATASGAVNAGGAAVAAGGEVTIAATGLDISQGSVSAQTISLDAGGGVLNNTSGNLTARAVTGTAMTLQGQGLSNDGGAVTANAELSINAGAGGLGNAAGRIVAVGAANIRSTGLNNVGGAIASNGNLTIDAAQAHANAATDSTGGTLHSGQNISLTAGATTLTNATVTSGGNTTLHTGELLAGQVVIAAGGGASITATQGVDISLGKVSAQVVNLTANGVLNNASGILTASANTGTALTIQSQGVVNDQGTIASNADLSLHANTGSLSNGAGRVLALGAADIRSTGLNNVGGTIAANGDLTVNAVQAHASATTDSTGGTLQSGQAITLTAGATRLTNATVTSGGNTTLNTGTLQASQARINVLGDLNAASTGAVTADRVALAAGGSAAITAAQGIDVSRGSVSAQAINLNAGGVLDNDAGSIQALGALDTRSTGLNNRAGTIAANGNLTINAAQAHANAATDSTGGTVQSAQAITLTAGATTLTNATVTSGGNTLFTTGALQASEARINVLGNLGVMSDGAIIANRTAIAAGGSAAVTAAQGMDISQGSVSAHTLTLDAGGVLNTTGANLHAGATTGTALTLQSQGLVNDQGTIVSSAGLSIRASAGSISNMAGQVLAQGAADIRSTGLNNVGGAIAANGNLTVNAVQTHANATTDSTGGTLQSGQAITLTAGATTLTNATVTSGGNTTLNTAGLLASQARINVLGDFIAVSSGAVTADQVTLAAGGNASITAAHGMDVSRGAVSAQAIDLNAGGVLNNDAGSIQALGALDIRATGLNNRAGTIAANGNLTLNAAQANPNAVFDSTDGAIRSAQAITLTAGATTLTNATVTSGGNTTLNTGDLQASRANVSVGGNFNATSSGTVTAGQVALAAGGHAAITAVQGMDLTRGSIGAQTLSLDAGSGMLNNNAGSLIAVGAADVRSTGLNNMDGTIAANGALAVNAAQAGTATETNNTRGTIRSAQSSVTLTTGALTNANADIGAAGDVQITATGALINEQGRIVAGRDLSVGANAVGNTSGLIAGNRNTTLTVGAGGVANAGGTIQSASDLAVTSAGDVGNTGGKLLAGNQLALTGGALTNSQGRISAQAGSVTLAVTSYTNSGGSVVAGGALSLDTQGGALTANGSTFASGGDMALRAGAAQFIDSAITASGSLAAQTTGLQADRANVQAGGNLSASTGAGAFNATNSTWQAGQAVALAGGAVALSDATVAANTTVAVTGASVDATRASITSAGDVSVVAASGALNIAHASLLAGRDLTAAGTGAGTTTGALALAGRDLTLGNGAHFDFAAVDLQYQFGRDLSVRAQGISTAGQQVSARNLTLDAGSGPLNNQGGNLQATGTLTTSGTGLNNQNGVIAANGQVTANASSGTLNNAGGQIYSTQGAASVTGAIIDNVTGIVSAATDVSITGGALDNAGNTIAAGRNLTATLSGAVNNAGGRLIGNTGAASVTANGINNQSGTISGATSAAADAGSGTLANTGGLVTGQSVRIGGEVNNSTGVISGSNSVSMTTRAIDNDAGVIESGVGGISIDTQGHALTNTRSGATRGIVSQGGITIAAGDINNQAGYIGANGSLNIAQSANINNQGGTLLGLGNSAVNTSGILNNQGSSILGGADMAVSAGTLDNSNGGTIYAGRDLGVSAGSIDNSNTRNGAYTTGLLAGRNASITAGTINNSSGAIVALSDATVRAGGSLNNTQGQISGNTVTIQTPALTNTAGRADAQQRMTLQVPQFSADGVLASNGTLNLELQGNYVNTGVVSASGDLSISTTGSYTNLNRVSAQNALSLTAAGIDNAAGATIDSRSTTLNAGGGTINNAGLINSTAGQTSVSAGTLNNTGRIYGDSITLSANVTNSAAGGAGGGGAIATRGGNVTINGALNNTDDALVLSLSSIQINGSARNDGATINAMGNVAITGALTNTHVGLQTSSQTRTEPAHAVYITPSGSTTRYNRNDLAWTGHSGGHWVLPSTTYPLGTFGADPKPPAMQCGLDGNGGEGGNWACNPAYGVHDPIWAQMRVASPGAGPGSIPMECMDYGGETGYVQRVTTGACGGYWNSYDAYTVAVTNSYASLDAAINAFNTDLDHRTLIDWYETTITGATITETTAVPGRAAKVLAGGNISIGGGSNVDSVIVAGGNLNGGGINNIASQGTRQTSTNGYYVFSHRTWSGGFSSSYGRETSAPQPIADAPSTQTMALGVLQYQSSGSPSGPAAGGSSSPVGGAAASVVGIGRSIGSARNTNPTDTASGAVQTGTATTGAGGAVQVNSTTVAQAQSAPTVHGVQVTGGDAVTAGNGNLPTGSPAVVAGSGNNPTGAAPVTAGTRADPTGGAALAAGAGNNPAAGMAVTAGAGNGPGTDPNAGGTVQPAAGTHPNGAGASLSAPPGAALPGSVIAAGVRAEQLAAITTSLTDFAAAAALQPVQADAVDTSTRRSAPATVKAAGYSTVQASGRVSAPANQLFTINRNPRGPLVETDPAFTGYRQWISSAYMLQQLSISPERNLKLYGDGFAEQRLIDDQILALTGRRFLSGYQSTEDQYHELMDAGVMYAREYQLTPGVALSAEQMALLTTDIVWLESKEVTLPDGSASMALVPTVYLRRPVAGDLTPTGALIAGANITLRSPGDLSNSGTVYAYGDAAAGNGKLVVDAQNVNNTGALAGNAIQASAQDTINNTGGVVQGLGTNSTASLNARDIILRTTVQSSTASIQGANGESTGTRTNADRIATVSADSVRVAALNNITLGGASITATGNLAITAGGNIVSEALQTGYTLIAPLGGSNSGRAGYISEAAVTQQLTNIAGNNVAITATGDAAFKGTSITAANDLAITGKSVTIEAVKENLTLDQQGIGRKGYERVATSDETLAGANVTAANKVTITATGGNLTGTGAAITATNGAAALIASGDVNLNAATTQHSTLAESFNASSGFLSNRSTTRESDTQATLAVGSQVTGNTVAIVAGRDVNLQGSAVVSDLGTTINAARNVSITAATETLSGNSFVEERKSGFGALGGLSFGKKVETTEQERDATSAKASSVASLLGNVNITAGQAYTQTGSNVLAPVGDVTIAAKTVAITEARETDKARFEQTMKQSGISVSVSNTILDAGRTIVNMADAAGKTDDPRMQALAAAAAALKVSNAAAEIAKDPSKATSVGINLSIGSARSHSLSTNESNSAAGSAVAAGGNLIITATGAGANSNIVAQGVALSAGGNATLKADGQVQLLAAQNAASGHSENSSSSSSLNIGANVGSQGVGITVGVSASKANGNSNSQDTTWINTQLTAGNTVRIDSGGDTTFKGAVVAGETVKANVGGKLTIESLQDTSTYGQTQKSAGFSAAFGAGGGGSISASKTNIDSTYQSVGQQSAIRAGDGGFQVDVKGETVLTGGVITSTQKALDDGKNDFTPGGKVIITDLQNSASYDAKSVGGTVGTGGMLGSSSIGIGSKNDSASSTTQGGISGIAGNAAARTGDAETGLKPIFNASKVLDDVNAQVSITQVFGQQATKAAGNYAQGKLDDAAKLRGQAEQETDPARKTQLNQQAAQLEKDWGEGGTSRTGVHAFIGLLTGGVSGAAGAVASQLSVAEIGQRIRDSDLPITAKHALVEAVSIAIGAAAGGAAGAAAAGNATANNYLSHNPLNTRSSQLVAFSRDLATCKAAAGCNVDDVYRRWGNLSAAQQAGVQAALAEGYDSGDFSRFGQVVAGAAGALGANPADYCSPGDARCTSFIADQNRQAASVLTTAIMLGALEDVGGRPGRTVGSASGAKGGVVAGKTATGEATAISPLDWSIVGKTGETRAAHINAQHGNLNLQKPSQGVFYGDPVAVTNDAWAIAQTQGIKPITANGVDIYVIPRPNSGYSGGYKGVGENLNSVTILTEAGTSKMITSYPGNGTPLPKAP